MSPASSRRPPQTYRTFDVASAREQPLVSLLREGDLLVVNDSGVLPASIHARTPDGRTLELRLLEAPSGHQMRVVALGAGDYRTRTEDREAAPQVAVGEMVHIGGTPAFIETIDMRYRAVWTLRSSRPALGLVYDHGRPIQYAHVPSPLHLWDVDTVFAGEPWSVEAPSALFVFDHARVRHLRARGVRFAALTHAAGVSATGDAALDAALPLAERTRIPPSLVDAVHTARAEGGRIIGVGTTVARALEGTVHQYGKLQACDFNNTYRLGPSAPPQVLDGMLTGVHEPGTSHFELLQAFVPRDQLLKARALSQHYLSHEFGDTWFVSATKPRVPLQATRP